MSHRSVWVQRDSNGEVSGYTANRCPDFDENLDHSHPDVQAFEVKEQARHDEAKIPKLSPEIDELLTILNVSPADRARVVARIQPKAK